MATHEYYCHFCGADRLITTRTGESPPTPRCCNHAMAKRFGFSFPRVPIEIASSGLGRFGSMRAYNTARDRHSDEHSERVGRAVTYETFDPRDPTQDPTSPSAA